MDKTFYKKKLGFIIIECIKLRNRNELIEDAYKITIINNKTNKSDFVTTNTPQAAITLADNVFYELTQSIH